MPGPGVPPGSLREFGKHPLRKGTVVHRFYSMVRDPNIFNPCLGAPTRFAPLRIGGPSGTCVPTLYIGQTYEAAAFETIFRNLPPRPLPRRIYEQNLNGVGHARLRLTRNFLLAPFFHQNLGLIGQTRQTMIDTDATAYADTVQWAACVYRSFPKFDGIIWASHQHDRDFACVLFGDRVSPGDLQIIPRSMKSVETGYGKTRLNRFARGFRIDIIRRYTLST